MCELRAVPIVFLSASSGTSYFVEKMLSFLGCTKLFVMSSSLSFSLRSWIWAKSTAALSLSISLSSECVSSSVFAATSRLGYRRLQRFVVFRCLVEFLLRDRAFFFEDLFFGDEFADLEVNGEEPVVDLGLVFVELLDALLGLLTFLVDLGQPNKRFGVSCRVRRRLC